MIPDIFQSKGIHPMSQTATHTPVFSLTVKPHSPSHWPNPSDFLIHSYNWLAEPNRLEYSEHTPLDIETPVFSLTVKPHSPSHWPNPSDFLIHSYNWLAEPNRLEYSEHTPLDIETTRASVVSSTNRKHTIIVDTSDPYANLIIESVDNDEFTETRASVVSSTNRKHTIIVDTSDPYANLIIESVDNDEFTDTARMLGIELDNWLEIKNRSTLEDIMHREINASKPRLTNIDTKIIDQLIDYAVLMINERAIIPAD